jgi:hypothetical protein
MEEKDTDTTIDDLGRYAGFGSPPPGHGDGHWEGDCDVCQGKRRADRELVAKE